jgi:hypothetical protein
MGRVGQGVGLGHIWSECRATVAMAATAVTAARVLGFGGLDHGGVGQVALASQGERVGSGWVGGMSGQSEGHWPIPTLLLTVCLTSASFRWGGPPGSKVGVGEVSL